MDRERAQGGRATIVARAASAIDEGIARAWPPRARRPVRPIVRRTTRRRSEQPPGGDREARDRPEQRRHRGDRPGLAREGASRSSPRARRRAQRRRARGSPGGSTMHLVVPRRAQALIAAGTSGFTAPIKRSQLARVRRGGDAGGARSTRVGGNVRAARSGRCARAVRRLHLGRPRCSSGGKIAVTPARPQHDNGSFHVAGDVTFESGTRRKRANKRTGLVRYTEIREAGMYLSGAIRRRETRLVPVPLRGGANQGDRRKEPSPSSPPLQGGGPVTFRSRSRVPGDFFLAKRLPRRPRICFFLVRLVGRAAGCLFSWLEAGRRLPAVLFLVGGSRGSRPPFFCPSAPRAAGEGTSGAPRQPEVP